MIKRILVGLGGTPFTAVATRCATELGDIHQAQLTGVTIVDTSKLEFQSPSLLNAGLKMKSSFKFKTTHCLSNPLNLLEKVGPLLLKQWQQIAMTNY